MIWDLARGRFGIHAPRRRTAMFWHSNACSLSLCYPFELHDAYLLPPSFWLGSDTDCTTMTTFWCLALWYIAFFLHTPSYREQHSILPRQCDSHIASRSEFALMVIDFSGNPTDGVFSGIHVRDNWCVCVCVSVCSFCLSLCLWVWVSVCVIRILKTSREDSTLYAHMKSFYWKLIVGILYVRVCRYVYIYTYSYIYTHTYLYVYICNVYVYIYIFTYTYVFIFTNVYIYENVYAYTYTYIYI